MKYSKQEVINLHYLYLYIIEQSKQNNEGVMSFENFIEYANDESIFTIEEYKKLMLYKTEYQEYLKKHNLEAEILDFEEWLDRKQLDKYVEDYNKKFDPNNFV